MPRPQKPRAVRHDPNVVHFKPAGVPMRLLEEVSLGLDELEAMRLADIENLSHEEVGQMILACTEIGPSRRRHCRSVACAAACR